MKLVHQRPTTFIKERDIKSRSYISRFQRPTRENPEDDLSSSEDWPFKGFTKMAKAIKAFSEFNESNATTRSFNQPNVDYLQGELVARKAELSDIRSNYWLVHKSAIQGVSGFLCRRCLSFESDFIRNLGYDMTAEVKHVCDETKIKSTRAVSIRKSDVNSRDNFCGRVLFGNVDQLMPGIKYLTGRDLTQAFNAYKTAFSYEIAKYMIGIPDRYSLYRLSDPGELTWLNKALVKPGEKTELKEEEVIDFLGKVKSSYAMFEIPTLKSAKMIFLTITL